MPFDTIQQGIKVLQQQMHQACQAEEVFFYLPLLGKRFASSEAATEDLETSISNFTSSTNSKRVCALLGEGGSGKSSFLKQFTLKLLNEYALGKPIPLFISLPLLTNPLHAAIEEPLRKTGFDEAQIEELKVKYSFVFILDGYDEIHQLQNLYVSNRLSEWKAKTIISCRSQYLYNKEQPNLYFMPLENEREQAHLLQTLYVAPFNQDQIKQYLEFYHNGSSNIPSYEEMAVIPGLQDHITTPFLLKLAVESLPEILARHTTSSSQERQQLTQTDLYKSFVGRWFEREEKKLKDSGQITADMPDQKPIYWRYCQSLALEMHKHNLSWLNAEDERFSDYFENDAETEMLRSACPIRKTEEKIGFWHESLGMHFVAQTIYRESIVETHIPAQEQLTIIENIEQERPQGTIHLRLITDDLAALRNLADEVNRDERYKLGLFDIIERSKANEHYTVGAANAISALNLARESFSCMDFQKIRISGANLNNGIFDSTNFSRSDLSGVNFSRAWLRGANFNQAKMDKVKFGERPNQKINKPHGFCYLTDSSYLVGDETGNILLYNIQDSQVKHTFIGHTKKIINITFSTDKMHFVSGSEDETVCLWSLEHNQPLHVFQANSSVKASFSTDRIIAVNSRGTFFSWGFTSKRLINSFQLIKFPENNILFEINADFSFDGEQFSLGNGKELSIWNLTEAGQPIALKGSARNDFSMGSVAFSRDGEKIAFGGTKILFIWHRISQELLFSIKGDDWWFSIAFSPDGNLLATGSGMMTNGNSLYLWDAQTGKVINKIKGFKQILSYTAFSPDAKDLAVVNSENDISLFNMEEMNSESCSEINAINSVAFNPTQDQLFYADSHGAIQSWDMRSNQIIHSPSKHVDAVLSLAFHPNGEEFVSGSQDRTARLWRFDNIKHIGTFDGRTSPVSCITFSPDGRKLAIAFCWHCVVYLIDFSDNSEQAEVIILKGHTNWVNGIAFSLDGKLLLSSSGGMERNPAVQDNSARLWNVRSGREMHSFKGHTDWVNSVAFNPIESQFISGGRDKNIRLWNLITQQCIHIFSGHEGWINSLLFPANGQFFASGSEDGTVRLWSPSMMSCLLLISNFMGPINSLAMKNIQGSLFMAVGGNSAQFWQINEASSAFVARLIWTNQQLTLVATDAHLENVLSLSGANATLLENKQANLHGQSAQYSKPMLGNYFETSIATKNSEFQNEMTVSQYYTRRKKLLRKFKEKMHREPNKSAATYEVLMPCPNRMRLLKAVADGEKNLVIRLLKERFDPHLLEGGGFSAIFIAILLRHTELIEPLLAAGADVDDIDTLGNSPLYAAAGTGQKAVVQLLIAWGANVNHANYQGVTVLDIAMNKQYIEILNLLIAADAELGIYKIARTKTSTHEESKITEDIPIDSTSVQPNNNSSSRHLSADTNNSSSQELSSTNEDDNITESEETEQKNLPLRDRVLSLSTTYLNTYGSMFHETGCRQVEEMKQHIESNPFLADEELSNMVVHAVSNGKKRRDHFQSVLNASLAQQGIFSHTSSEMTGNVDNAQAAAQKSEKKKCVIS